MSRARGSRSERTTVLVSLRFHPEYGGPGIAFKRLAPKLEALGLSFIVLARRAPGLPKKSKIGCMTIFRHGASSRLLSIYIASVVMRLVIMRRRYRNIHVHHSGWATFLVPLIGRLLGKRTSFTMTLLDSDDPEHISKMTMAWLKLRLFRLYDRVIYINPEQAGRYERIYRTKKPLIPGSMGVDMERFQPCSPDERLAARRELGISEDAVVAAFTGDVARRKGIDLAIEIWLRVAREEPRAKFIILGALKSQSHPGNEFYRQVQQRVEDSGMADHFEFLASAPDINAVRRLLRASDIFLFPSRSEGTPSAVMEAMACEIVPVIAPLQGFANCVVRDGIEGLVLEPLATPGSSVQRILQLLGNSSQRQLMGARARERISQSHSEEFAIAALLKAWDVQHEKVAGSI